MQKVGRERKSSSSQTHGKQIQRERERKRMGKGEKFEKTWKTKTQNEVLIECTPGDSTRNKVDKRQARIGVERGVCSTITSMRSCVE